ncbi:MAG TPA: hypothetical protein VGF25_02565 [Thermoleophilaceae bacterium]|jgi:hypothetical protein
MLRLTVAAVVLAMVVPLANAGAKAVGLIASSDVKNNSLRSADLKNNAAVRSSDVVNGSLRCKDFSRETRRRFCTTQKGEKGDPGPQGPPGPTGAPGPPGAPGKDAQTKVSSLPGEGFDVTNASVSLTPDGVEFGPYADGGATGGSLYYSGLNGQPLSAVRSLIYKARYTADNDTGGVGVPYLRIFLEGDQHDAVFSPNTQPPDSDTAEGPFHTWAATSGLWRYDDDAGAGGEYGLNGAPFSTVAGDHGDEIVSGIYISTGFSNGTNLAALLRSLEVNGERFVFGS